MFLKTMGFTRFSVSKNFDIMKPIYSVVVSILFFVGLLAVFDSKLTSAQTFQNLTCCNICRVVPAEEAKGWVSVGGESTVAVVANSPGPPQHSNIEVEDPSGIPAPEKDGEQGYYGQNDEGDPKER